MSSPGTPSGPPRSRSRTDTFVVGLIGPIFLVAAAWFVFGAPRMEEVPRPERVVVDAADIEWPLRPQMPDPPTMQVAVYTKKCTECHDLFVSDPDTPLRLNQHRNIVQAHGMNDRCFNCHDRVDRGRLVLPGGSTVSFADAPRLCATCHGTTYRDWQIGIHGRTIGSWDPSHPEFARLNCTDCHDPHAPAFAPMNALAGPNTLRMGERPEHHDTAVERNPLRKWAAGRHGGAEARTREGEEH